MADLIDRQALLEEIDNRISNIAFTSPYQDRIDIMVNGMERVRDSVEYAPAVDAAEVVRCKECEHYKTSEWMEAGEKVCKFWVDWIPTSEDDFCSCGERRSEVAPENMVQPLEG